MDGQLLSATERDTIVSTHLQEHLPQAGLTERAPRSWVDGSQAPVRRLFEIQLLKGAAMKACWGWSLDFVPHISGGRVCWHRTDKTARLDIIIDPRGLPQPSFLRGAAGLADALRRLLPEAMTRAVESWRRGATLQGMLDIIKDIRDQRTNAFYYDNYSQLPLAYAFLSAKTGDLKSADAELDRYAVRFSLDDEETAKLHQLARDYATPNESLPTTPNDGVVVRPPDIA